MNTTVRLSRASADSRRLAAARIGIAAALAGHFAAVALMLVATVGFAHHSPGSVYVVSEIVVLEGTVTDYRFNNPHVRIHIDVVNEDGEVEDWIAEGGTPNVLLRNGWSSETFKPGDPIHIVGNPPRAAGTRFIHMLDVTVPDGSKLFAEDVRLDAANERRRSRQR